MARLSLQVRNIASLFLALGTSVASGVAAKRFFDAPRRPWGWLAVGAALFFLCQIGLLLFVESKEEEELSLFRTERLDQMRHTIEEREKITQRIQREIESGDVESAAKWHKFRKELND